MKVHKHELKERVQCKKKKERVDDQRKTMSAFWNFPSEDCQLQDDHLFQWGQKVLVETVQSLEFPNFT